jgi:16S rRNA G1207 methylase RsmC
VINRLLSLKREVERVFGSAETVGHAKGYVVIRAVKRPIARGKDEDWLD